jgi:hypothetical protein
MVDREPPAPAPEPDFKGPEQNDGAELANEILESEPGGAPPAEERAPAREAPPAPPPQEPYVTPQYLEERDKRQKAEQELKQWHDWRAEVERAQQKPAAPEPDPYLQPAEYVERQIQARMTAAIQPIQQVMSQLYHQNKLAEAKRQYGDELAEKAYKEFDTTTMPRAEWESVVGAQNPFAAAVEWKRRRDALAAIGDDPAKFEQSLREKLLSDPQFLADVRSRAAQVGANGSFQVAPQAEPPPAREQPRDEAGRFQPLPSVNRAGSAKSGNPRGFESLASQSDEDLVDEILSSPHPSRR